MCCAEQEKVEILGWEGHQHHCAKSANWQQSTGDYRLIVSFKFYSGDFNDKKCCLEFVSFAFAEQSSKKHLQKFCLEAYDS